MEIKKCRVRFIAPDSFVIIRRISLPAHLVEDEIRGYLFMELGTTIPLPFDNPVFDYVIFEKTKAATTILLFAAPEDLVLSYAQLLEDAKLRPIAADVSPLCCISPFLYSRSNSEQSPEVPVEALSVQQIRDR